MEISAPLNLIPVSRPPPSFAQFPMARQTPRSFNTVVPKPALPRALPELRSQTHNLTPTQDDSATEPQKPPPNTNPWKMTREFDEILEPYVQTERELEPEPEPEPESESEPEIPSKPRSELQSERRSYPREPAIPSDPSQENRYPQSPRSDIDSMAGPRETLPIGFDPNYAAHRQSTSGETRTSDWLAEQKARYIEDPTPAVAPQPNPIQGSGYSPDWITQEPRDITDIEYYDPDPDGGLYTYGHVRPNAAANVAEVEAGAEFESPRQAPYDHRQTMVVTKEDIDFYMALVGGADPPPASVETQTVISEEQEFRRRSQDEEVREVSLRRQEELETTQGDVDFWMSLMQKP